jgi:hypothetical protein
VDQVLNVLKAVHPSLDGLKGLPLYVFLLVAAMTLAFLVGYVIKGTYVWFQLRFAIKTLRALRASGPAPDPSDVSRAFQKEPLKHLWDEYADTLHQLRKAGSGEVVLTEFRATVPAEAMFTKEVLVDGQMFDEFTRHMPGVLTGLGIIGTFAGLLSGLEKFKVDPSKIENTVSGLGPLLEGVQHAFVASGAAIACAMLVVFISRFTLAYFYRLVEQLTTGLDSLYRTGAGEEYLARLVKSSELSAANTAQLKDALVEDLHTMMTNLVDRQIAANEAASLTSAKLIGDTIATAIAKPMEDIGEVIKVTARGNGDQVSSMLETLLTGFMAKLEDTFGGQMRGINEQMQRSIDSMATVQASLQALLADIKLTNEQAASQMSGTLEDAMKRAADNQQLLTDQMRTFVQDFRQLVTEEQNKSKQAMDEAVMKVLREVTSAMNGLEAVRREASKEESARTKSLSDRTDQLVGGLTTQVETLLGAVSDQISKTQRNIDALGDVSLRAIDGMNNGALIIGSAAQRFETAGNSVSDAFDRSKKVSDELSVTADSLQAVSAAVLRGFEQYDSTRKTVDMQVAALMGLIESVKKEAGVSQDLVTSIKSSAEAMRRSEAEARSHLDLVNAALVKSFGDFGNALVSQVKSTIAETDRHLAQGTGHLNGVVQELANAVQRMKRA